MKNLFFEIINAQTFQPGQTIPAKILAQRTQKRESILNYPCWNIEISRVYSHENTKEIFDSLEVEENMNKFKVSL